MRRALRWRELIAGAFGLAVAVAVYLELEAEGRTAPVVVAAKPIAAHARIGAGDVRRAAWPSLAVGPEMARTEADVVGRWALRSFAPGEPIVRGAVSADPAEGGLRGALPPGYAAVAVPVADPAAIPPVAVGDRVDLVFVSGRGFEGGFARLLLRGVDVVGLGTSAGGLVRGPAEVRSIVVAVTPADAERVAFALANGEIVVALEGYEPSAVPTAGVDGESLFETTVMPGAE